MTEKDKALLEKARKSSSPKEIHLMIGKAETEACRGRLRTIRDFIISPSDDFRYHQ